MVINYIEEIIWTDNLLNLKILSDYYHKSLEKYNSKVSFK